MVPAVLHRWPYVVLLLLSLLLALVGPAPVAQNRQAEPDLAELLSRPTASFAERKRLVEDCLRAGMLYEERGRQRSALLVYGHALQIWPNHPEILPHYQRLGRGISAQEPAPDPDAAAALEARQRMEAQRARARHWRAR